MILDLPVVLYRKRDGTVVALDDRCPHRWAPLSRSWVEGDDFEEDDDMICAVLRMIERDPRGAAYPEIMVATDQSAVQARRLLQRQLAAERHGDDAGITD